MPLLPNGVRRRAERALGRAERAVASHRNADTPNPVQGPPFLNATPQTTNIPAQKPRNSSRNSTSLHLRSCSTPCDGDFAQNFPDQLLPGSEGAGGLGILRITATGTNLLLPLLVIVPSAATHGSECWPVLVVQALPGAADGRREL